MNPDDVRTSLENMNLSSDVALNPLTLTRNRLWMDHDERKQHLPEKKAMASRVLPGTKLLAQVLSRDKKTQSISFSGHDYTRTVQEKHKPQAQGWKGSIDSPHGQLDVSEWAKIQEDFLRKSLMRVCICRMCLTCIDLYSCIS
jgi:hypothetical protein